MQQLNVTHHQSPFKEVLCWKCRGAEQSGLLSAAAVAAASASSLTEWELSETNYRETIFITLLLRQGKRGDGPADLLGSRWEQASDTLSHSPALIVQKMWFVPRLYFLGKVVFTVGGVPVAWIASLFNNPETLCVHGAHVCVRVCVRPRVLSSLPSFQLVCVHIVLKVICTHFVCPSSLNKIFPKCDYPLRTQKDGIAEAEMKLLWIFLH